MTAANRCDSPNKTSTAFGSAIVLASPALQRFALRLTKNHAAAEDLVQDTLTRAWAAQARFEPGSNTKAWLFRIARNVFLSGLRRTRREVAWDPDRHHLMLVQEATQDDALYSRDVQAAVSLLPAGQRVALLLVAHTGMSMADAADELGIPSGTVKSRVGRARASIRAYVTGDAGEDDTSTSNLSQASSRPRATAERREDSADRLDPSRYHQWKASGATSIG